MPDYKETNVTGTQWQRCNQIHIDNPTGGVPMITFAEEVIARLGDETFIKPGPQIHFPFDPSEVIALRDTQTNEPTGAETTAMDVYIALFSMYMQKAAERDTA